MINLIMQNNINLFDVILFKFYYEIEYNNIVLNTVYWGVYDWRAAGLIISSSRSRKKWNKV